MESLPELRRLARIEGAPCVTLYLNTRLKEPDARERARVFVRRRIDRALLAGMDGDAREDLERVRAEASRRVDSPEDGAPASIAVFSCAARDVFRVVELDVPVEDQLVVGTAPALKQLASLCEEYERTLLVLVSSDDARIYEIVLGRVDLQEKLESDKVNQNRAPRTNPGWVELHYQRQVREMIERHLREVADRVTQIFDRDRPERFVVGGAQPTIDRFLHELPQRLRTRVVDVVALPPEAAITEVVHAAMASNGKSAVDGGGVRDAVDLALAGGPAALGIDEVIDAAREQRLMTLFLDPGYKNDGWRCVACSALCRADEVYKVCQYCEGRLQAVELAEALVRQTILQGGEVELVPRSPELARFGGLAALLRW